MSDRTPVTVAGLIMYRDRDKRLHTTVSGLPETFAVSATTVATLRLKHDREAYVVGDRLIISTAEDVAGYTLVSDAEGMVAAVRFA